MVSYNRRKFDVSLSYSKMKLWWFECRNPIWRPSHTGLTSGLHFRQYRADMFALIKFCEYRTHFAKTIMLLIFFQCGNCHHHLLESIRMIVNNWTTCDVVNVVQKVPSQLSCRSFLYLPQLLYFVNVHIK